MENIGFHGKIVTLLEIWNQYKAGGFGAISGIQTPDAIASFYVALLAFNNNHLDIALSFSQKALGQDPSNPLYGQASLYLQNILNHGKKNVYVSSAGFTEFIRGGGNIPLYQSVNKALSNVYRDYSSGTILDIGVGDGLALLPALIENIRQVDVLEPSTTMLHHVCKALTESGISHEAFESTLQDFIKSPPKRSWDVIQSTFCLQSIAPEERATLLKWLAKTGSRLILAEFDVPKFSDQCSPDRFHYVSERYNIGLAEYRENQNVVAQGFLMPVFFGYFDSTSARTNFEHPIQEWIDQLRSAGYRNIEFQELYSYWWAPSFLIDAKC